MIAWAFCLLLLLPDGPRSPWTASRFVGGPDPPPPYRLLDSFPEVRFEHPVEALMLPGGNRFVVAEQGGKILSFEARADTTRADLLCDLAGRRKAEAIYGMAFSPGFAHDRRLYVTYVLPGRGADGSRLVRFRLTPTDPPTCDLDSETVLFTWLSGGHNGGALAFGRDGRLFLSTGDAAAPQPPDTDDVGQSLGDVLSAILRLDVDGAPARAPEDNPFVRTSGARPEIWAYGLRNPWKISVDPSTEALWVGDVGWDTWEMIHRVERGGNYGWSVMEGPLRVRPQAEPGPTPIQPAVAVHGHAEARSITGGHVYRGQALPRLTGAYVYGDFETGKIWGLRWDARAHRKTWQRELADTRRKLVAFAADGAGELYALDYGGGGLSGSTGAGGLYRVVSNPAPDHSARFPRRLGASGLFSSVAKHALAVGVVPYRIAAEAWADGAQAERFLGLPGDSSVRIEDGALRFPSGAVLGRTVSVAGRRVETQVLHLDGAIWNAYTYRWNAGGTDAALVAPGGEDAPVPDGRGKTTTWHFAARAECGTCHNVWSGPVLGFIMPQLGADAAVLARRRVLAAPIGAHAHVDDAFVDPHDEGTALDRRVRSWLHVNCAHCHRPNGGGLAALDLTFAVPLDRTGTIGTPPRLGTFGIPRAQVVAPGEPERSVLLHRLATAGTGRMPRIGSRVVDQRGVALVRRWIAGLAKPTAQGDENAPPPLDRTRLLAAPGEAGAGRAAFFAGAAGCILCHAVAGQGAHFGPDLSGLGTRATREQIVDSLLAPSKTIDPRYVWWVAELVDAEPQAGLLEERTSGAVVLRDAQGAATRIPMSRVKRLEAQTQSPMPEGLLTAMSTQDAANLLAFLSSLK